VVEGHRDADAVLLRVVAVLADEEAVVEDVRVAERGALGRPGGAARVLDVDRLEEVELGPLDLVGGVLEQAVADEQHVLERRQVAADLVDHRPVVGGLERGRRDQRAAAGLAQRVGELARPVRRVDVDEDDPELRGRELGDHPLGAVRRPDAGAVALDQPEAGERAGGAVDDLAELRIGEARVLVADDERVAVGVLAHRAVEALADRLTQ
jgi:hypothetical protein